MLETLSEMARDVAKLVNRAGSMRTVLQGAAELVVTHLDAAFARVWTYNESEDMLELQASAGMYTHIDGGHARVPLGSLKIGLIAKERTAHLTNDVQNDPRVSNQQWARDNGIISFAGYPLLVEDQLIGVMALFSKSALGNETVVCLEAIADNIAGFVQRKWLDEERRLAEERVNQFYSTVSHELRTPIASIKGALSLVNNNKVNDEQKQELLELAQHDCERLTRLVNDILDLRKVEAGKLSLNIISLPLAGKINATVQSLSSLAKEKQVNFEVTVPNELCIAADEDRFVQIMTNLVANAIKFSPPSSTVVIQAEPHENTVRCAISDSGPGIKKSDQWKLFGNFQQIETADGMHQLGSGLGLAISKALVENQGGKIGIDSEEGHGTTFWFELPASRMVQ